MTKIGLGGADVADIEVRDRRHQSELGVVDERVAAEVVERTPQRHPVPIRDQPDGVPPYELGQQ